VRRTATVTALCSLSLFTLVAVPGPPASPRPARAARPAITGVTPGPTGTAAIATAIPKTAATGTTTAAPPSTQTSVVTATGTVTTTPGATSLPRAKGRPTSVGAPRPTATPAYAPRPTPTPDLHPGFGAVPWTTGEYSVWTIDGLHIHGTAYGLLTRLGHQWIDSSATQEQAYGLPSAFASRLAFDVNTYRLRRYDGVEDTPASVLHATLFGPHLDYTSYQSWGRAGCTVAKGGLAPVTTAAYGMMADLLRAKIKTLRDGARGAYTVFDPYGARPTASASYTVQGHEILATTLGTFNTAHVRFLEGAQPPLDVWYRTGDTHPIVKFGQRGVYGATLTHYEAHSARVALPVLSPVLKLTGKNTPCM